MKIKYIVAYDDMDFEELSIDNEFDTEEAAVSAIEHYFNTATVNNGPITEEYIGTFKDSGEPILPELWVRKTYSNI